MTQKELAEAYYAVAAHMKLNADHMLATVEQLLGIADRISDELALQKPAEPVVAPETQPGDGK